MRARVGQRERGPCEESAREQGAEDEDDRAGGEKTSTRRIHVVGLSVDVPGCPIGS